MVKPNEMTSDIRDKAQDVRDTVRDLAGSAKEAASHTMDQLRETAATGYQRGKQKLSSFEHSVEKYIRDEPMKSVLIAAGLGLLIGFIWRRD